MLLACLGGREDDNGENIIHGQQTARAGRRGWRFAHMAPRTLYHPASRYQPRAGFMRLLSPHLQDACVNIGRAGLYARCRRGCFSTL